LLKKFSGVVLKANASDPFWKNIGSEYSRTLLPPILAARSSGDSFANRGGSASLNTSVQAKSSRSRMGKNTVSRKIGSGPYSHASLKCCLSNYSSARKVATMSIERTTEMLAERSCRVHNINLSIEPISRSIRKCSSAENHTFVYKHYYTGIENWTMIKKSYLSRLKYSRIHLGIARARNYFTIALCIRKCFATSGS
jgi:hypothetical protein